MNNKICVRPDELIKNKVKLKDYIEEAVDEVSLDYILLEHEGSIDKVDAIEYIRKYRNILLAIKEICKDRKRF